MTLNNKDKLIYLKKLIASIYIFFPADTMYFPSQQKPFVIGCALSYRRLKFWLPFRPLRKAVLRILLIQNRERVRLLAEMNHMRGLLPLLMKQRNGYRWTELDRKRIKVHLQKLVELSPYMVLFIAPGGFFVLPLLAWWLDRRQDKNDASKDGSDQTITEKIPP